jgi:hypothetical protein
VAITTQDIARSALGAVGSDANFLLACGWVSERYANIVSRVRFKHLRRVGEFIAPGIYSTGTVSITSGTNTLTGSSSVWTPALEGRHFRGANAWYRIAGVPSATDIRLESTFTETTLSAASYVIAARHIALDPKARWLGSQIIMGRTQWIYTATPFESMDTLYGGRMLKHSSKPIAWAEIGSVINDGQRAKQIEIYPALTSDEIFYYLYWELPTELKEPESILPPEIDLWIVKEGVLVDLMRHKMAQALDAGKQEAAAHWRNEYRAQETRWESMVLRAIQADKGVDDSTFILQSMNTRFVGDITSARQEIAARGNWP